MVSLGDIGGLWRRALIAWPDGRTDATTEVFWLQGPRRYADLRIPEGRPQSRASCLRDLDWTMLRFMAGQEGFIGEIDVTDSVGHWRRIFDYQPKTDVADRGSLAFEDDTLVERGTELPYVEHWRREPGTERAVLALWLVTEAPRPVGCLVAAGSAFIYARGRVQKLPRLTTLTTLLDAAVSLEEAQALFDCEISFGRRSGEELLIERSSLPFREGQSLAPHVDSAASVLTIDDQDRSGAPIKRTWRIAACESTIENPFAHCFGSERPAPVFRHSAQQSPTRFGAVR
jgi:hypothetical protein